MPILADDDVVVHGNAERARHLDDRLRHLDVGARGRWVARGMVVQEQAVRATTLISTFFQHPTHVGVDR